MKKNFKKLNLNKSTLSNLEKNDVNGGIIIGHAPNPKTIYNCPVTTSKCFTQVTCFSVCNYCPSQNSCGDLCGSNDPARCR